MWMPFAILALIMGVLTAPGLIAQTLERRRAARTGHDADLAGSHLPRAGRKA